MASGIALAEPATLMVGGTAVTAEVADTVRSFWMKNTPLPLSIAYLSKSGQIVHIAAMTPLSEEPVSSVHPTMYALEMTQGWFADHGVKVGQSVSGLPAPARR